MRYSWALDMQFQLLERWHNPAGRRFIRDFYNHIRPMGDDVIDNIISTGVEHCEYGETFAWSTEMCDLLMDLASDLPDWSLTSDLLPAPYGFMVFENPLKLDILEETWEERRKQQRYSMDVRAIGWNCHNVFVNADGTSSDQGTSVDPDDPDWARKTTHVTFIVYSHLNSGPTFEIPDITKLPAPFVIWNWKLGDNIAQTQNRIDREQEQYDADAGKIRRGDALAPMRRRRIQYFGAALLLMNQKILVDRKELVKQSLERKMRNAGWKHDPNVRVVVLRHTTTANPEGPARDIERTHRWWTRSHWRQQAYGPKKSLRKPLLIFAHLNGPEGLPVKPPKKNLFAVVQ